LVFGGVGLTGGMSVGKVGSKGVIRNDLEYNKQVENPEITTLLQRWSRQKEKPGFPERSEKAGWGLGEWTKKTHTGNHRELSGVRRGSQTKEVFEDAETEGILGSGVAYFRKTLKWEIRIKADEPEPWTREKKEQRGTVFEIFGWSKKLRARRRWLVGVRPGKKQY